MIIVGEKIKKSRLPNNVAGGRADGQISAYQPDDDGRGNRDSTEHCVFVLARWLTCRIGRLFL